MEEAPAPAPPSWIILSTTPRVSDSDTTLPDGFALSLEVQAPPRISFLTVDPSVCPNDRDPSIEALDPSGLLLLFTAPTFTYCVLDVRAAKMSYRLPQHPPSLFDNYTKVGVIADPAGAAGAFVLADFQFVHGTEGNEDSLVRYWSRTRGWYAELEASPDDDEVPDRFWDFDDVVSHDHKIWWIDTDAGLLTCNNFFGKTPPYVYVPLPEIDHEKEAIARRYVKLSNAKFRCIQIGKPKGAAAAAAPTFITMRALMDPKTAYWTEPEYKLSFADMRASDAFKAAGLPEDKDPVFALIHPQNPDVLYFFLGDYLFAFDMRARKLIECERHGLESSFLSSDSVRAWELPPDYAAAIAPAAAFRH